MSESESDLAFSLVTYNLCHSDMLVALRAGSDVEPQSGADATPPLLCVVLQIDACRRFHQLSNLCAVHIVDLTISLN